MSLAVVEQPSEHLFRTDPPVGVVEAPAPPPAVPTLYPQVGDGVFDARRLPDPPVAKPRTNFRAGKRRRIRKAPRPVSLVHARLARGEEIVQAAGNLSPRYRRLKRGFDVAGAVLLLLLLWPLMLGTWLVLCLTTRGKPIFKQVRLGYRGRPFTMYKFRTMRLDALETQHQVANEKDGPIFKNRRDPRITTIGRFLRSTSIDELPQLFNVLRGEMSLVGPRPPIGREVAEYEPWHRGRLAVKPGLTCLWQVSGRSEVDFDRWVRMDLWYVRNQDFLVDLKLLLKTPWSVLSGRGAY